MDIKTYPGLDKQIDDAIVSMGNENTSKLKMGYLLIKDGTPEAELRKKNTTFYFPKEVGGKKYLICKE